MRDDRDDHRRERYGWQPGEKEQVEREMAEREAWIKRDEILAWCASRSEARGSPDTVVTKSAPAREAAAAPAMLTREWQDYIRHELDRRERAIMSAIAQVIIDEERQRRSKSA